MQLLGDVGGFNAIVTLVPAYFMSFYSQSMFTTSVSSKMHIKDKRKQSKRMKLKEKVDSRAQLDADDVKSLSEEIGSAKLLSSAWAKGLCY